MKIKIKNITPILFGLLLFFSCNKDEKVYENPYIGGKEPLGVKFNNAVLPDPLDGEAGSEVFFSVSGLKQYENQFEFLINGRKADILELTDSGIKVRIPNNSSTGLASIVLKDQVFFGPSFKVNGKLIIDPEFRVKGGSNNTINKILALNDGRYLLVGGFTDYEGKGIISPVNRIVRTFKDGSTDASFARNGGSNGTLNDIFQTDDNKFIIAGSFSGYFYENKKLVLPYIKNITLLGSDGSVDSVKVATSQTPTTGLYKAVPRFNGGTDQSIKKIFSHQNKIIAIGDFRYHLSNRYDLPKTPIVIGNVTIGGDSLVVDSIETRQVLRFNIDGSLDKTYRFNINTNQGLSAGNGSVNNGCFHSDGKLVLVGNFQKFDEAAHGRIVRLKADGTIDQTFNTGSGADKAIYSIVFNETTQKYIIAGAFTTFNGSPAKGLAILNLDGSIYNGFESKGFTQGYPTFVKQLSNGLIVVSGTFSTYDDIKRTNFMILNTSGNLAQGYNATGDFNGVISDVYETTNSEGNIAIRLVGRFSLFDGVSLSNITQLVLEP